MSARSDNERLTRENEELRAKLAEAESDAAVHLANVERLAPEAARTKEAEAALGRVHKDRDDAWKRATALEQQVDARDVTIRGLTEERDTAVAAVEAMRIEDVEAGFAS